MSAAVFRRPVSCARDFHERISTYSPTKSTFSYDFHQNPCVYRKKTVTLQPNHNPPHVHFTYGDYKCSISVLDRVVDGQAPAKVIAKVNQWIDLHEQEILTLWENAQEGKQIGRIEPLK